MEDDLDANREVYSIALSDLFERVIPKASQSLEP